MNAEVHATRDSLQILDMSQVAGVTLNSNLSVTALKGGAFKLTRNFNVLEMRSSSSGNPLSALWGAKSVPEESAIRLDTTIFDSMVASYTFSRSGTLKNHELYLAMNDTFIISDKPQLPQGDILLKNLLLVLSSRNLTPGHSFTTAEDTSFSFLGEAARIQITTDFVMDGLEAYEGRQVLKISFTAKASFSLEIPDMFTEPLEFSVVNSGFMLYDYSIGLPLRFTMKSVTSGKTSDSDRGVDFTYDGELEYDLWGRVR